MDDELQGFARASVRLRTSDVDSLSLPSALRERAERGRTGKSMVFVIPNPTEARMGFLLTSVKRFLQDHAATLAQLRGVDIDLFLGWAPKAEQETMIVDAELIGLLARLNAPIVFDTYNE